MNILKQILSYSIWIVLSFLLAFTYMRIVLGAKQTTGISKLFNWIYDLALFQVGSILGGVIAFLFVLIDVLYLKKRLQNHTKKIGIRFVVLIGIAVVIVAIHYICEKVIDII